MLFRFIMIFLFILSSASIFFKYDLELITIAILIIDIMFVIFYFGKMKSLYDGFTSFLCYIYIWISCFLCASFMLAGSKYSFVQYANLATFSIYLMFVFFLCDSLISLFAHKTVLRNIEDYYFVPLTKGHIRNLFLFIYILAIVGFVLGIGKMGREPVQLPLKMTGIIMLTITDIVPYLFLLIIAKNADSQRQKLYYLLIFLWGLFECFARYSKSALVISFLPIFVYYLLQYRSFLNLSMMRSLVPILLVFFMLYPILGVMRYTESSSLVSEFENVNSVIDDFDSNEKFWEAPFNRVFSTGAHYMRALPYIESNDFFDFSRLPLILFMRGSEAYTTYVIDGFPPTAIHSSGTTGIMDALLLGGYGFCFFTVFLLCLLATWVDKSQYLNKRLPLKVFFVLFVFNVIRTLTFSRFINPLAYQTFLVQILIVCIYVSQFKPIRRINNC